MLLAGSVATRKAGGAACPTEQKNLALIFVLQMRHPVSLVNSILTVSKKQSTIHGTLDMVRRLPRKPTLAFTGSRQTSLATASRRAGHLRIVASAGECCARILTGLINAVGAGSGIVSSLIACYHRRVTEDCSLFPRMRQAFFLMLRAIIVPARRIILRHFAGQNCPGPQDPFQAFYLIAMRPFARGAG